MNEKCACRKVDYMPISNEDGTYTEQWMCLECKSIFIRKVGNVSPTEGEAQSAQPQLDDVKWCATEDGSAGKGTGRHIAMFILDPEVINE